MRTPVHEVDSWREKAPLVKVNGSHPTSDPKGAPSVREAATVIIEYRALNRECLCRGLSAISAQKIIPFATIEDWLAQCDEISASAIVLGVAGEPGEAEVKQQLARLIEQNSRTPVIVICDVEDPDQIVEVLDAGVRGYVPTSLPLDVAVECIRLVMAGGVFAPASSLIAARRAKEDGKTKKTCANEIFTARQASVVEALRRGKANKVIAYELSMSESTVKVHIRNIMKKLRARNRTEVAFMTNGLFKGDHP